MGDRDKITRVVLLVCVLGTTSCILSSCGGSKGTHEVGRHTVVIIETPLFAGRTSTSSLRGADDHYDWFTYESRNLKIRLENEVLTVNGAKYLIPNKDDSITIRNERVAINGRVAKPEQ